MQFFNAVRTPYYASTFAFIVATSIACCSGFAQGEKGGFEFSPPNRNFANPSAAAQDGAEFSINDLRGPRKTQEKDLGPNTLTPNRELPRSPRPAGSNSILDRLNERTQAEPNQRAVPKFDPSEFARGDAPQKGTPDPSEFGQPLRPRVEQARDSLQFPPLDQGTIRPVSATLQDDGRNSAMGTQPLGNSTQTTQQFSPQGQQPPTVQQKFGNPTNSGLSNQNTQSPFQPVNNPNPVRQQLTPPGNLSLPNNNANFNQANRGVTAQAPQFTNPNVNSLAPNSPPTTNRTETAIAKQLMNQYSVDSAPQPLPGQPTSLEEMLQRTPVQYRSAMVKQYWDTYEAWCAMMCSAQYANALNQIVPPNNPAEKNLLNTANSIARNELLDAEIKLTRAQANLQKFIPNSQNELILPLPSDQPVISSYTTYYDYYSSRRQMTNEIRNIASSLPKMLMLISQRAETAQGGLKSMQQIRQLIQDGQAPVSEALQAVRMWSDANKQVVESIVDYNQSIATYSLNIMGNNKSPDQMAVALVGKKQTQPATTLQQPAARQATLPGEYQRGTTAPAVRQTFTPRTGGGSPSNGNFQNQGNPGTQRNLNSGQGFRNPNSGGNFRN